MYDNFNYSSENLRVWLNKFSNRAHFGVFWHIGLTLVVLRLKKELIKELDNINDHDPNYLV